MGRKYIDSRKLRKSFFVKRHVERDEELIAMVKGVPSHQIFANSYHRILLSSIGYLSAFAQQWFGKDKEKIRILDWGCGKGHVTYLLQKRGFDVVSCDVEESRFKTDSTFGQNTPIIDRCGVNVVPLKHPVALPFEDASFDCVLSNGVLEHVPNDLMSLSELQRVTNRGGVIFCFALPGKWGYITRAAHLLGNHYHDRLYDGATIKKLLNVSGFELLDIWHRALLPKSRVKWPSFIDYADDWLTFHTFLKHFATSIEFVAYKK